MNQRTTIIFAIVTVILGGYIYLHERHTLTTGELQERHDRLLTRFVRARVTRVELRRGDTEVVIERDREEDEAVGEWRMMEPIEARTDGDNVDTMLGALQWARARQTLAGISAEDREAFGLDAPRLTVWFNAADQRVPVHFGSEDPTEGGLYVQLDDPTIAYVVGLDTFEALDHDPAFFRSKELFPLTAVRRANSARIHSGDGVLRTLERRDGQWWATEPWRGMASRERVSNVLDAVASLQATRFVSEGDGALSDYGLEQPTIRVSGLIPALGEGPDQRFDVTIGAPCADHPNERYARADDGPVICLLAEDIEDLTPAPLSLRETQITSVSFSRLRGITLQGQGARAHISMDDEGEWEFEERGPRGAAAGQADADAVEAWLSAMRELGADDFSVGPAPSNPTTVTLSYESPSDNEGDELHETSFRLWVTPQGWRAQRDEETDSYLVTGLDAALVVPNALRFLPRQLVEAEDEEVRTLTIRRAGDAPEVLARDEDDRWRVRSPVDESADIPTMNGVTRRIATLEAVRFVARSPAPEHALGARALRVRFEVRQSDDDGNASQHTHSLQVGAESDDGPYARLDDGPVFILSPELYQDLVTPLRDRARFRVPRDQIGRVVLERGSGDAASQSVITWGSGVFSSPDLNREEMESIIDQISALRAVEVAPYRRSGAATPVQAAFTLEIHRRDDSAPETLVALATGAGQGRFVLRRGGESMEFSAASMAVFVDETPTTAPDIEGEADNGGPIHLIGDGDQDEPVTVSIPDSQE